MQVGQTGDAGQQNDAQFIAQLPHILAEFRLGIVPRLAAAVVTACLALIWLPPTLAFAPLVAIVAHEFGVFPLVIKHIVMANAATSPHRAVNAYRGLIATGALVYAASWGVLFLVGDVVSTFIGACWLWGAALHNQVYFSRRSDLYLASLGPHIAAGLIIPFFAPLPWWGPLLMGVATLFTLVTFVLGFIHRRALAQRAEADRAARENAEQSSLAKTRFLATMSHELRTPLNAIIGYSEILEEDITDGAPRAEDARRVQQSARHLLSLINEILDLSRIEAGRLDLHRAPSDLESLLRHAVETLRPLARTNANDLSITIEGDIPALMLDEGRVRQCVFNLVSNACKFTQSGQVRVHASYVADVVAISVSDTGVGIAAEAHERLFQPFEQVGALAASKTEGTGLGLAITRRLARAMGGDVTLRSAPGEGSVFALTFRAEEAPSRRRAAA